MTVAICDYGAGNLRSVAAAFRRLGVDVVVTAEPETVLGSGLAVLPGVGSAGSAMSVLCERKVDAALRARVAAGRPTLGICLGLQLALDETEEDGGVDGLGILPGRAARIRGGRVPRIGWAAVEPDGEEFYFAHAYTCLTPAANAWSEGLVAEARRGSFVGVQFHPEKSGAAGARYLEQCLSLA